jgi:flavin reductase (DIM6/NTAB) family NADH-FMN oxidoreductase RutF
MKRPWNMVDLPVYSLVTSDGIHINMNICTYVSAVSMKPKRYAVAVYKGTKSLENIAKNGQAVLQLMASNQYPIVRVLGQKSGLKYDKEKYLRKKDLLESWGSHHVLKGIVAMLELKVLEQTDAGDHILFLCDVVQFKTASSSKILTIRELGKRKIIRI